MEKVIHIMTLLICCVHVHHYFQNLLSSEALIARILPFFLGCHCTPWFFTGGWKWLYHDSVLLYDSTLWYQFYEFQNVPGLFIMNVYLVNDVGLFFHKQVFSQQDLQFCSAHHEFSPPENSKNFLKSSSTYGNFLMTNDHWRHKYCERAHLGDFWADFLSITFVYLP